MTATIAAMTTPRPPRTLGDWLEHRCAELGMKWIDLANAVGITRQSLRDIRNGKNIPRPLTRRSIERVLEWEPNSIDRILAGGEPTDLTDATEDIATMSLDDLTDAFTELAKDLSDEELLAVMTKALAIRRQARERDAG